MSFTANFSLDEFVSLVDQGFPVASIVQLHGTEVMQQILRDWQESNRECAQRAQSDAELARRAQAQNAQMQNSSRVITAVNELRSLLFQRENATPPSPIDLITPTTIAVH